MTAPPICQTQNRFDLNKFVIAFKRIETRNS
jgi:hypothetical protein